MADKRGPNARNPADVRAGIDASKATMTREGQRTASSKEIETYQRTGISTDLQRKIASGEATAGDVVRASRALEQSQGANQQEAIKQFSETAQKAREQKKSEQLQYMAQQQAEQTRQLQASKTESKSNPVLKRAELYGKPSGEQYLVYYQPMYEVDTSKRGMGTQAVWGAQYIGTPATEAKEREEFYKQDLPSYKKASKPKNEPYVPEDIPITKTEQINKKLSDALPEWREEGTTELGKAFFQTKIGAFLSEDIVEPVYKDIKAEPLKAGTIAAVSFALPYVRPAAAAGVYKLGSVAPTVTKTLLTGGKVAKTGLILSYAAMKAEQIYTAPTLKDKGRVVRKTLTTEIGPAFIGAQWGAMTQPAVTEYTTARYRSVKYAGKWKIPLESKRSTYTWDPKTAQADLAFNQQGVQTGYQLRLQSLPKGKAEYVSQQAQWMPGKLSKAKITYAQNDYLGKWVYRPLNPEVVDALRTGKGGYYSKDLSYFVEPSTAPKEFQTTLPEPRTQGLFISPELKPPIKPEKGVVARMLSGKKASADLVLQKPQVTMPFSAEYWERVLPKSPGDISTISYISPPGATGDQVLLGSSTSILFQNRIVKEPETRSLINNAVITKQIPIIREDVTSIQIPEQKPQVETITREIQEQKSGSRAATVFDQPIQKPTIQEPIVEQKITQPEIIEPFRPRIPPIVPKQPEFEKERSRSSLFKVLVRSRGIFREVTRTTTAEKAFLFGKSRVESTAAASFKVVPVAGSLNVSSLAKRFLPRSSYYESKKEPGVFIQKKEKRISTPGEKKEITFKGLLSIRGKKIFGGLKW